MKAQAVSHYINIIFSIKREISYNHLIICAGLHTHTHIYRHTHPGVSIIDREIFKFTWIEKFVTLCDYLETILAYNYKRF